jgi:hypothetical protein
MPTKVTVEGRAHYVTGEVDEIHAELAAAGIRGRVADLNLVSGGWVLVSPSAASDVSIEESDAKTL